MIPIIFEDIIQEPLFSFTINLPLVLLVKEPEFVENVLPVDLLTLHHKATGDEVVEMTNKMGKVVKDFAEPTLLKLLSKYPDTYALKSSRVGGYGKDKHNKDTLSFSYYFDVSVNTGGLLLSDKVENSLSNIGIRIANHISPQEYMSIRKYDNVRLYMENMIDLYEDKFIKYTTNILDTYVKFLRNLSNYPNKIETFDDIVRTDIEMVKKYAKQGFDS